MAALKGEQLGGGRLMRFCVYKLFKLCGKNCGTTHSSLLYNLNLYRIGAKWVKREWQSKRGQVCALDNSGQFVGQTGVFPGMTRAHR